MLQLVLLLLLYNLFLLAYYCLQHLLLSVTPYISLNWNTYGLDSLLLNSFHLQKSISI